MATIDRILAEVAIEQSLDVVPLSEEAAGVLTRRVAARFARPGARVVTYEVLSDFARFRSAGSWELIAGFNCDGPVVLFANPRDSSNMFRLDGLVAALTLLAEAPPFDFYLVDFECTFLFAHDEYDNLYGSGDAKRFVEGLA